MQKVINWFSKNLEFDLHANPLSLLLSLQQFNNLAVSLLLSELLACLFYLLVLPNQVRITAVMCLAEAFCSIYHK
jgi:hypothetical protein